MKRLQIATANHCHPVKYFRQHILPSASEVKDAIENYIDAMVTVSNLTPIHGSFVSYPTDAGSVCR